MDENNKKLKALYIGNSLYSLEILVTKDESFKNLKKAERFNNITNKLKTEILQCQDDQEKCYILCRRYHNIMDYLFKICDDRNYVESLYLTDLRKVTAIEEQLKIDLERRYNVPPKQIEPGHDLPPGEVTSKKLKRKSTEDPEPTCKPKRLPLFMETFINPGDLLRLMRQKVDFLLVDVRTADSYQLCHVNWNPTQMINIPEGILFPGLSAHTLGELLDVESRAIWDKRDKFKIVILIDTDTDKYNFTGTKLERIRDYIVQWDCNRNYENLPVVLNGGVREFVEWYPSEVTNSQSYLAEKNADIDELLDLDEISYPEQGSPSKQMNLKFHEVKLDQELSPPVLSPTPEPMEGVASSPPILTPELRSVDSPSPHPFVQPEGKILRISRAGSPKVDDAEIRSILEGAKASLLEQARANKPLVRRGSPMEVDDPFSQVGDGLGLIKPPPVDRSAKPSMILKIRPPGLGEGYTTIKNYHNNCFMSAILQGLKVIPLFKTVYVTTNKYIQYTRKKPALNLLFGGVMRILWEGSSAQPKSFWPDSFKAMIDKLNHVYVKREHEDAFEFFMFLFNTLSEECAFDVPRPMVMTESEKAWYAHLQGRSSFLIDAFYYQLRNSKTCYMCNNVTLSYETDNTLMLAVPQRKNDLQQLIEAYLNENLVGDFACTHCKTITILNKRDIIVDPEVLVIILKRYCLVDRKLVKNTSEVAFPQRDLIFGSSKYDLFSVIHHVGYLSQGHYFASALINEETDRWVVFNDDRVNTLNDIANKYPGINKEATGFFYVKKGPSKNKL